MNQVATFFRDPAGDAGSTYQFQVKTDRGGAHQYFVYTRSRGSANDFADRQINQRELDQFRKQVEMTIRSQGGGVMVIASGEGTSRDVGVSAISTGNYVPAARYTVLRPGYPSHTLPVKEQTRINVGSHLLVPVDEESEERLANVLSLLQWFRPDVEALVANAIARPSLDARLAKLESRVLGDTAGKDADETGATWWARFGRKVRRVIAAPALYASIATALLVALLGLNTYLLKRVDSKLATAQPAAVAVAKGADTQQALAAAQPPVATIASRTKELLNEVRQRSTHDRKLKALYDAHFAPFDTGEINDAKASEWFSRQAPKGGSRPLLLGLIKLQVLKLKPDAAIEFLENKSNVTETKNELAGINYQADVAGLQLMAVLSCRMGYDSSNKPQVPTFDSSPPLVLMPNGRCDALGDQDIEAGLDHLLQFVRSL
ncbi:MAG: hypothetical protein M3Q69_16130 [Acidobacteriota bacterium]|nr:hypothetical protein [Acidobacteriota bacterium]